MTQLNQLVAIEKTVKSTGERALTDAYHAVQVKNPLAGISRTYEPKNDDGDELPPESTLVQQTVDQIVAGMSADWTRMLDVTFTKETANTTAKADIVVDGETIAKDVPVTYLLFLERKANDLGTLVKEMPTLDAAEEWEKDPATDTWVTKPSQTVRTKKVPRNWVKAEATDKHPAQVEMYHEDVNVGTWTTRKFSGAIPMARKIELTQRVTKLSQAIKFAREQANSIAVTDRKIGEKFTSYVFKD